MACSTFYGNIDLAPTATGDIRLDGIKKFRGFVRAEDNESITGISGTNLTSLGNLSLIRLPNLLQRSG